ncbi:MAG: hypothetical protein H0T62_10560 [Parachlamydiaceae bacterium]|nr:hypothetical protein [Parachlamydiaceae bacterium]
MNSITFFNEKTPLSSLDKSDSSCTTLEPTQYLQLKKISMITLAIFAVTLSIYYIYDGAKTLSVGRPLKTKDLGFSIVEIASGFIFLMLTSGCTGAYLGNYQSMKKSYPHHEAYQGTFLDDITSLLNSPQLDNFDVKTWTLFLSNFLKQFDPVLLEQYFILKKVNSETQIDQIEYFCKKLRKGCCFGYSMAMLAKMKEGSKLPSRELKNSIKIENVVFFQLVNNILFDLNSSSVKSRVKYLLSRLKENENSFKEIDNLLNVQDDEDVKNNRYKSIVESIVNFQGEMSDEIKDIEVSCNYRRLFLNYCNLFSDGLLFYQSESLKKNDSMESQCEILLKEFQKAETEILTQSLGTHDEMSIAGYISLQLRKENDKRSGHAFFFQMSGGYFRFMDSGSPLNHFFEFQTKDTMITGLVDHLKACYGKYKDVEMEIILLGIPRSSVRISSPITLEI